MSFSVFCLFTVGPCNLVCLMCFGLVQCLTVQPGMPAYFQIFCLTCIQDVTVCHDVPLHPGLLTLHMLQVAVAGFSLIHVACFQNSDHTSPSLCLHSLYVICGIIKAKINNQTSN
jgi:hypothetical protein